MTLKSDHFAYVNVTTDAQSLRARGQMRNKHDHQRSVVLSPQKVNPASASKTPFLRKMTTQSGESAVERESSHVRRRRRRGTAMLRMLPAYRVHAAILALSNLVGQ